MEMHQDSEITKAFIIAQGNNALLQQEPVLFLFLLPCIPDAHNPEPFVLSTVSVLY